ncbi:hypothetical protein HD554DRAFT_2317328 [Boletus coccyginus]|nr:hypothetical protein HD554DRAFT_2317328 [Boletus coccyginus]
MQLQALCFHLTTLLLFIASSVQAGPVGLAHRDIVESGGYIEKRDIILRYEQGLEETGGGGSEGGRKREALPDTTFNPSWSGRG